MLDNHHAGHHADKDKDEKNEKLNTEISRLQRHGAAGPSGLSVLQRPRPCPWERCDRKQHSIHCRLRNRAWFQFRNHFPTHLFFQSCCHRASVTTAGASRAGFYKRSGRLSTSWISYAMLMRLSSNPALMSFAMLFFGDLTRMVKYRSAGLVVL